jgi:hypothetical protein
VSSPVPDVYRYVIIIKLLDSIFFILPVFICWCEIQTYWDNTFLTKWKRLRADHVNPLPVYSIKKLF